MTTSLHDELIALRDEIRLLRQVLDEVREELSWANNNAQDLSAGTGAVAAYRRITSLPLDPTARPFPINAVDEQTLNKLREEAVQESRRPPSQRSLF